MLLDFDNGIIKACSGENKISIDASATSKPFTIGAGTSPAFSVDWNGSVEASSLTLRGKGTGKGIGFDEDGKVIDVSNKSGEIYLSSITDEFPLKIGTNFKVGWDGSLYAANGYFGGNITASQIKTGMISGVEIGIGKSTLAEKGYNFYVGSNGILYATGGNFSGSINTTSGSIAGLTIGTDSLSLAGGGFTL